MEYHSKIKKTELQGIFQLNTGGERQRKKGRERKRREEKGREQKGRVRQRN